MPPHQFHDVDPGTRRRMRSNRRTGTKPEVSIRSALHRRGMRFRVDQALYTAAGPVRPDIVFPRRRLAIFVDGCFWHGCPDHGTMPRRNADYWAPKLARNRQRDQEQTASLREAGWHVLRFWEHEAPDAVADAIEAVVRAADDPPLS